MDNEERREKLKAWAKAKPRGPLPSRFVPREKWLAALPESERARIELAEEKEKRQVG